VRAEEQARPMEAVEGTSAPHAYPLPNSHRDDSTSDRIKAHTSSMHDAVAASPDAAMTSLGKGSKGGPASKASQQVPPGQNDSGKKSPDRAKISGGKQDPTAHGREGQNVMAGNEPGKETRMSAGQTHQVGKGVATTQRSALSQSDMRSQAGRKQQRLEPSGTPAARAHDICVSQAAAVPVPEAPPIVQRPLDVKAAVPLTQPSHHEGAVGETKVTSDPVLQLGRDEAAAGSIPETAVLASVLGGTFDAYLSSNTAAGSTGTAADGRVHSDEFAHASPIQGDSISGQIRHVGDLATESSSHQADQDNGAR
jgi:hypothetical protein